jgi:23S rRNA pseudouridine1911/1915/1917 synthase
MIPFLYEDDALFVIDKPAGMVVNNATSAKGETVQNFAKNYLHLPDSTKVESAEKPQSDGTYDYEEMFLQRSGIVHRLDKETSGVLVIAKNAKSFEALQKQFRDRQTHKIYLALVHGILDQKSGEVNAPTGRLPWNRTHFGVVAGGRDALTTYTSLGEYKLEGNKQIQQYSYLEVMPKTGRTHQIRVHMKHINHPIVGDALYAGRKNNNFVKVYLSRMFLHATSLTFSHPETGTEMTVTSPLPKELQLFLDTCEKIG